MKQYWRAKTSEFLSRLNIEHKESGDTLKVSRDSIAFRIEGEFPEESNENLIKELNKEFGKRFNFSMKDDDFLWLEIIDE